MSTHEEDLEDIFYFSREILGYKQLTELHLGWFDALLKNKNLLLLAPVGHLKTTVCSICWPLWNLTRNRELRILLVNEVLSNCVSFLREIKGHITSNERFRKRYGLWDLGADSWSETRIQIERTSIRKEPSITVASVGGTVVSQHPDLIVCDDLCSNRNTQTHSQRAKTINWFQRDLLPRLDASGQILIVGTRFHSEDIYGWLKDNPGYSHWKTISQAAEWTSEDGKHHVLFPEKFNAEKLAQIKAQLGTQAYSCLYLNSTQGEEGADFKASWIDSARYDLIPPNLSIFAGIDLAISRREGSSRFAYCIIGKDTAGTVYVLDAYRDRIPFNEQLKAAKRLHKLHQPRLIVAESNGYQAAFAESLRTDEETRRMPLKTIVACDDKLAKIRGLAPLFENGVIRLPQPKGQLWLSQLEEEILRFPDSSNDMIDAMWLAIQGIEIQRVEPRITYTSDL
jgi:predicted phage terminase large subunit-like protein